LTWNLPAIPYVLYRRNPIDAVIAQLRFLPVLRIDRDHAGFQDRVRGRFPRFGSGRVRDVSVDASGVQLAERANHTFKSLDGQITVGLSASDMSISSKRHARRSEFLDGQKLALDALLAEFGPIVATRLGLRYVNRVRLTSIRLDLGEPTLQWDDLVHRDFLRVPCGLADLAGTHYLAEVRSTLPRGELTLRYGLVQDTPDAEPYFRLDTDRYIAEEFDAAGAPEVLAHFAAEIYAVFRAAAAPALLRWMQPIEEGSHA
jgi:uncharacterized protein (TIGR04255 family)